MTYATFACSQKSVTFEPSQVDVVFCNGFSRYATATLSARRKIGSSIETFVWRGESRGRLVLVKVMVKVM